jgi:hypothetical protein
MMPLKIIILLLFVSFATAKEMTIHLKDPSFQNNILKTEHGGVIENEDFRIQAEKIIYDKNNETIQAEGDLMMVYEGRTFIGESLFYDMKSSSGEIIKGKTYDGMWIVGGDKVVLKSDKSIAILNAFLTASEVDPPTYDLKVRELLIENKSVVTAKGVAFRFYRVPVFYLPKLKANIKNEFESPIRYKLTWDKGQGIKMSMRYCLYSSEASALFARLDLRTKRGIGGALETIYKSPYQNISGKTKSYLAHDTFWNDNNPNKKRTRWRLQGNYDLHSRDEKTNAHFQYDWISDRNMPLDFKGDSFELNTSQRTELAISHRNNMAICNLYARPNINKFQGFKQELPSITASLRPLEFGKSKILMENQFQASFLDYEYATDLGAPIPGFRSIRLDSSQHFYRAFHLPYLTITPSAGFENILYSNTQESQSIITTLLTYGAKASTQVSKPYLNFTHTLEPYIDFYALRPMKNKPHYIFDLQDGYAPFKQLKIGALNNFYGGPRMPSVSIDVNAFKFIDTRELSSGFAKLCANINLEFSRLSSYCNVIYNLQESLYDRFNIGTKWTLNNHFAIGLDFLHRSAFDYRKDDPLNYILDATVPSSTLLATPISAGRNLFLTKFELSLPPNWTMRFQSHIGWGRKNQPSFTEYRIDLFNTITSHWRLRLTYEHFTNNDEVSFGLSLVDF